MRILIAEDNPVSSRVLATTLTKWGHDVVATDNGLEAWAALQKDDAPRLAILDWMMPGIEGPEVCRRVRRNIKTAPIYLILLTALVHKARMVEGIISSPAWKKIFSRKTNKTRIVINYR